MRHCYVLKNDTLEEFIKGVSEPINLTLSKIALNLNITDQTGKGNKDIVRAYGKKVFEIMENTLVVKIPYNELVVNVPNDGTQNVAQNVIAIMKDNPRITRHVNNIIKENEIPVSVCAENALTAKDGK